MWAQILTEIGQLRQTGVDQQGRPYGIGRVGLVPEQSLYDFAMAAKRLLGANGIRLVDGGKPVHVVAVGATIKFCRQWFDPSPILNLQKSPDDGPR